MEINVIINNEKRAYLVKENVKHKAITKLREKLKKDYKKQRKKCNLWFINIKT